MKKNASILKKNGGYTLLFAVLVSSLVLAVGISILNINKKEFLLASSARESTLAFYAADSAIECAVYNAGRGEFATSSPNPLGDLSGVFCRNANAKHTGFSNPETGKYVFTFHLLLDPSTNSSASGSCATVQVTKYYQFNPAFNQVLPVTEIEARGYNVGWDYTDSSCTANSPRRVERAIRYSY